MSKDSDHAYGCLIGAFLGMIIYLFFFNYFTKVILLEVTLNSQ